MSLTHTGNAEIDQQHAILERLVGQLETFCPLAHESPKAECQNCVSGRQQHCRQQLEHLVGELTAFLIGHAIYEERMMELLPDTPVCQNHVRAHKAAHDGIARQLKRLASNIADDHPRQSAENLWQVIGNWLGDHAALFDHRLVKLGKRSSPEIDFDAELVAMLDQHVFPNRPTIHSVSDSTIANKRLEIRGRFESLTPSQKNIFWRVVSGNKNREIAEELGVSINTVKTHRSAIFQKFEVNSLVELIRKTDLLR